jgi:hypothetical protein
MKRALAASFALAASACGLLVGIGDHHLRGEEDAGSSADGDTIESGGDGVAPAEGGSDDASAIDAGPADGPVELARGQQNPSHIVADGTQLYWVNESDPGKPGAIMAMVRDGGQPYALAPNRLNPVQVRLDGTFVYFTDDHPAGGLFRVPRDGGTVELIDANDAGLGYGPLGAGAAICSEAHAFDGGGAKIRCSNKNPPQGAPCYPYATDVPGTRFPSVLADQTYTYTYDPSTSAIMRAEIADCTGASAIPFASSQPGVRSLGFHGQFVDWVTATDVFHLDQAKPGQNPTDFATGFTSLRMTSGYLSNGQLLVDDGTGMVWWVRTGGGRVLLGSGQAGPRGVVGDSQGVVYWTNRASGQIMTAIP